MINSKHIQNLWHPQRGDYASKSGQIYWVKEVELDEELLTCIDLDNGKTVFIQVKDALWAPSQSQVQTDLLKIKTLTQIGMEFYFWCAGNKDYLGRFLTMEQFWIIYFMHKRGYKWERSRWTRG